MLYLITGSDTKKGKARAALLAKGAEIVRFGEGSEAFSSVSAYLSAQGLFAPRVALFLDRPLDDPEGKELLIERFEALAKAETLVLVIEPGPSAAFLKTLKGLATIETFDLPEKKEEPLPSVFALTDAFASGDRKNAWVLYRRLIEGGAAPEEIHGALSWQARAIALVASTKSAEEAGLKPFVYSKAKRAAARLGGEGAAELSRRLMHLIHESRLGGGHLDTLLEAFLLKKA